MDIRLINLDRSRDRLAEFNALNGHMTAITRLSAVEGASLDIAALVQSGTIDAGIVPHYTRGALGNALSHVALWDEAISSGQVVTVCEDDAVFNRGFRDTAQRTIDTLPHDWDFILWGWNFDAELVFNLLPGVSPCLAHFDQDEMRRGLQNFQDQVIEPRPFRLLRAFGIPCYSVSPKGAATLKAACFPIRPKTIYFPGLKRALHNASIDFAMNDIYPSINAFVSMPPLALTKNEWDKSTVLPQPI